MWEWRFFLGNKINNTLLSKKDSFLKFWPEIEIKNIESRVDRYYLVNSDDFGIKERDLTPEISLNKTLFEIKIRHQELDNQVELWNKHIKINRFSSKDLPQHLAQLTPKDISNAIKIQSVYQDNKYAKDFSHLIDIFNKYEENEQIFTIDLDKKRIKKNLSLETVSNHPFFESLKNDEEDPIISIDVAYISTHNQIFMSYAIESTDKKLISHFANEIIKKLKEVKDNRENNIDFSDLASENVIYIGAYPAFLEELYREIKK